MLIRSQDKKILFDMTASNIEIGLKNEILGYGNSFGDINIPTVLGRYPTEQQAIEVLDEICENYQYIKVGETVGVGMSEPQYVFQMPEV